ncbi:MAG: hypothetical protein PF574_07690 [Candidatus Delongbacteria bacterium]|jgi:hypothetical protein|nr:hypothetical protein [Candidatus Delongbacteria bacterium]
MISFKKKDSPKAGLDLSVEKLALTNTVTIEALIQVLIKNKVVEANDILDEIKKLQKNTKVLKDEVK